MYLLFEHILVVLGVLAVALAMILALQQRRTPQSSAAWILFIILLPYVAVPMFLILGFRKEGRRFPPIRFRPPEADAPAVTSPAAMLLAHMGAPPATGGNRLALHETPAEARQALDALVAGAERQLDVLLYIIANDDSGRRFVAQLTEKVAAGVRVRVNIDWLGTLSRPRRALADFRAAGGELRYFSPFLHLADRGQLNLRNHRKLVIADEARVWAGGRNVGDDYLTSPPGEWTDLSFTAGGPVVRNFIDIFAADWDVAGSAAPAPQPAPCAPDGPAALQLVPAGPDEPQDLLHDGIVSLIHRADRRVWLSTPYFVPTEALSQALATAARRGIDVRLYLPAKSNQWTTDLARGPYLREVARAGCRVMRYQPGMLHAKAGLVDDTGWLGSANLDVRSMLLNFEFGMFLHDAGTVGRLDRWFDGLEPWCSEGLPRATPTRRLMESVFRLGAPIL